MYKIEPLNNLNKTENSNILKVWETSVRATHDFLSEDDISALKPEVKKYIDFVEYLYCIRCDGNITAFLGVQDYKIEMLFIDASERGKGLGTTLVNYAIKNLAVKEVDVNEQNLQAIGFYQHMGFSVSNRSETDAQGNPFPILHMKL